MFSILSSSARVVVVHGSRFSGKTTLVRTWLMTDPVPDRLPVFVPSPSRGVTSNEYWGRVLTSLCAYSGMPPPISGSDNFDALYSILTDSVLTAQRCAVVLVLDGIDEVDSAVASIERLLECGAVSQVIVTTRTAGTWPRLVDSCPDRMVISSDVLAFTEEELLKFLRVSGVPQGIRVARWITQRTGGQAALSSTVCQALMDSGLEFSEASQRLARLVDTAVDMLVSNVVATEPDLEPMSQSILKSAEAATLPVTTESVGFLDMLESAGMVESVFTSGGSVRKYSDAVRASLVRSSVLRRRSGVMVTSTPNRPEILDGPAVRAPAAFTEEHTAAITRAVMLRMRGHCVEAAAICDSVASGTSPVFEESDDAARCAAACSYLQMGITYLLADRLGDSTLMLRRARNAGTGMSVERVAAGTLALIHAVRGATIDAQLWIEAERQHLQYPEKTAGAQEKTAGLVASALVALDRLEPDEAFTLLGELGPLQEKEELWAFALYASGQYALLSGMYADGLQYVESEQQSFAGLSTGLSGQLLLAVRADLNLALGRVDVAARLVGRSTDPHTAAVRARICLLTGDFVGAETIVHQYGEDPHCPLRVSMELFVIGAAAACARGRRSEGRRHIADAVTRSRRTGALRPFTGMPPSMIREVAGLGIELPVDLKQLAAEFVTFRPSRQIVRLTPREREVLDGLLSGGSIGTIAKSQFVSLNTVKTQLRSLYRKLGVNSRRDAVAVARRVVLV
ncbi:helix-turn-helix transcriptional regulator [Rhodococcus artemisiae]|uniref:LuxR C-terminal-related transcriptional regulator n=1 Tax=Rhodococcus artemisiae TaxID=714159 RepID=A0ABU7L807_9NOCA|nr:LuxR C-terminal-related transcriptional regulator [Rhodococcus artemisiae]MEE2057677.1 LuxR C-terminal-related transcriptional regulator [Rhodococcus artemisiae]